MLYPEEDRENQWCRKERGNLEMSTFGISVDAIFKMKTKFDTGT